MEPTVLVERVDDHDSGTPVVRLSLGESVLFGSCSCGACAIDLELGGHLMHVLGKVVVRDDHWRLHNGGKAPLILENDAQLSEYLTIEPGGPGRAVPYDITHIRDAHTNVPIVTVAATFDPPEPKLPALCPDAEAITIPNPVMRGTKHFAVLASLCRRRLTEGPGGPLPSSADIATEIKRIGITMTPRAVDSQVDYLLDKLGLLRPEVGGSSGGRGWKRELLATEAVRRGIVTQADLVALSRHHRDR